MIARTHEFYRLMAQLSPFIREMYEPWENATEQTLTDILTWYLDRGLMSFVISPSEVHGVCLIRLFNNLSDFMSPWVFQPSGKYCLIELIVSSDPITTTDLFFQLFERWGAQEIVLWDRGARTEKGAPKMYRWDQFEKIVQLMSKGLFEPIGK
jgi:hypothetical protein